MKPVYQIEYRRKLGDCLRACLASIFEFEITDMPNYWEQTQETKKFWSLVNEWMEKRYGYRCVTIKIHEGHEDIIKDILCIAMVNPGEEDHAVVWKNGLIRNPSKYDQPFPEPNTFTLFVPINLFKE